VRKVSYIAIKKRVYVCQLREESMSLRNKMLGLIAFAIFDIAIPIPITALFLLYVLSSKPSWFLQWVKEVYK
jgi:hypothetical protein